MWFKASGPGPAHEGPLLEVFRRLGVAHVLLPLAVHPDRPWILLSTTAARRCVRRGRTGRATTISSHGSGSSASTRRSSGRSKARRASRRCSRPVCRTGAPRDSPMRSGGCSRMTQSWAAISPEERRGGRCRAERLRDAARSIRAAADGPRRAPAIAAQIQHDDLHGGNILVGPAGDRIFDWGDAAVAHPFGTLTTTFNSIAHKTGLDLAIRPSSGCATSISRPGPTCCRAMPWPGSPSWRAISRASARPSPGSARSSASTTDEMGDFGDSVAGWLMELADRLDGPPWTDRPTHVV